MPFRLDFLATLNAAVTHRTPGTRDLIRFPRFADPAQEIKDSVRGALASALGRQRQLLIGEASFGVLLAILERLDALEETYAALDDDVPRRGCCSCSPTPSWGGALSAWSAIPPSTL